MNPGQTWPGSFLSPESSRLPPMQLKLSGRSGNLQLSRLGDTEAGQPAAADNYLAVLPHPVRAQILALLAGFAEFFPGGFISHDCHRKHVIQLHQPDRRVGGEAERGQLAARDVQFRDGFLNKGDVHTFSSVTDAMRIVSWPCSAMMLTGWPLLNPYCSSHRPLIVSWGSGFGLPPLGRYPTMLLRAWDVTGSDVESALAIVTTPISCLWSAAVAGANP